MIVDIVISDLVPLRERGNYTAFVLVVYFVCTALGPYVGGAIVTTTTWRWVFWINLPVGGVSLIMVLRFLNVKHDKEMTITEKLKRIDYLGNALLIASTVSILFATTYGGTRYPFSHWRIVVPLVLGLVGLVVFPFLEAAKFIPEPVIPFRLFSNRTSATIFAATFLNSALLYWILFFLPACQTPLDESDQAAATATWSFVRSFGNIWGVAIPAAIFNNYFTRMIAEGRISDPAAAAMFGDGKAYAATADFINSFPAPTKKEIIGVYVASLKYVWYISVVFSGVAFFLVLLEKEIKMRTELDTEFGMADGKKKEEDSEKAK
ncbi:hypothetical protein F4808DRAFT_441439 [Astrocystis sublimbata]|nr:hypothetical protein F4808DRAFT_441439 [Astrocystis sublimbata]